MRAPFEVIPSGTRIDFIGRRRLAAFLSISVLLISAAAIPLRGIAVGIDFGGGTEIQVRFDPGTQADEGQIRTLVSGLGIDDPSVVRYGPVEDDEFLIRFADDIEGDIGEDSGGAPTAAEGAEESEAVPDLVTELEKTLASGIGPLTIQRVEFVGPRVGAELRNDGLLALLAASALILVYVAIRFSSRFAPGAIVAVLHDLLVTAGIFVILGIEFDLRILAAMLAILGYSLNDTIIIYDRIRENMELHTTHDLPEVLNLSLNQTLSRTILTSGTTMIALLSLFILGGEVIRPFAFAMIVGVLVGTYSSIYIASPTLLLLEGRYGGGSSADARPSGAGDRSARSLSEGRSPAQAERRRPVPSQARRKSKKKRAKGRGKRRSG